MRTLVFGTFVASACMVAHPMCGGGRVLAQGSTHARATAIEAVVALVDGVPIFLSQVRLRARQLERAAGEDDATRLRRALQAAIDDELIRTICPESLGVADEDIERRLGVNSATLQASLAAYQMTRDEFRHHLRLELCRIRLASEHGSVTVTEADIEARYVRDYETPTGFEYRVASELASSRPTGADSFTQAPSWLREADLRPDVADALREAEAGSVVGPLPDADGNPRLYVLLAARRPAPARSLAELHEEISGVLYRERVELAQVELSRRLRRDAVIEIRGLRPVARR